MPLPFIHKCPDHPGGSLRRAGPAAPAAPAAPLKQSKHSLFSSDRKAKPDTPKTPTSPTSPGGLLPPHLTTGESIRDKCIEMLAAALRTDSEAWMAVQRPRSRGNHPQHFTSVLLSPQTTTKNLEPTATAWPQRSRIISFH